MSSFCSMVSLHKVPTRSAWESETGLGRSRAVPRARQRNTETAVCFRVKGCVVTNTQIHTASLSNTHQQVFTEIRKHPVTKK